jgi:hypothetical protein
MGSKKYPRTGIEKYPRTGIAGSKSTLGRGSQVPSDGDREGSGRGSGGRGSGGGKSTLGQGSESTLGRGSTCMLHEVEVLLAGPQRSEVR